MRIVCLRRAERIVGLYRFGMPGVGGLDGVHEVWRMDREFLRSCSESMKDDFAAHRSTSEWFLYPLAGKPVQD